MEKKSKRERVFFVKGRVFFVFYFLQNKDRERVSTIVYNRNKEWDELFLK